MLKEKNFFSFFRLKGFSRLVLVVNFIFRVYFKKYIEFLPRKYLFLRVLIKMRLVKDTELQGFSLLRGLECNLIVGDA